MKTHIAILTVGLLLLTSCTTQQKIPDVNKTEETIITKTALDETNATQTSTATTLDSNTQETMPKVITTQTKPAEEGDLVATMKTTNGVIKIKLFQKLVPNTVNNFIGLAQEGYYDGIIFHRVINNFMIQGGDPTGTGTGGKSLYGTKFNDEFSEELTNIPGSLSMANSGPNTNGSQFFINHKANSHLDNMHSVFGQVVEGMENVNKIAKTKVGVQDKPVKEIKIISLTVEQFTDGKYVPYTLEVEQAKNDYVSSLEEQLEAEKKTMEAKKDKVIADGDTVSVHYTLTLEDGTKKDSSLDRGQPLDFTIGKKQVIAGWEKGLIGHKIGEKFSLEIDPKDGYGEISDENVQEIPKEQLTAFEEAGIKLETGSVLPTQYGDLKIIEASDTTVTIDANHELAGQKLFFDIEVIDIK